MKGEAFLLHFCGGGTMAIRCRKGQRGFCRPSGRYGDISASAVGVWYGTLFSAFVETSR